MPLLQTLRQFFPSPALLLTHAMEVEQARQPGGPSWAELPADVVQAIFRRSLADDARAGVMGLATCRPWRAALAGAPLRRLVLTPDMLGTPARNNRVACWLSKQVANSHLGRLRELVVPAAVHDGMSPALRLALAGLPKEELRSLRAHVHCGLFSAQLWQISLLSSPGLTSLHLTLHSSLTVRDELHKQLCELAGTLQDLHLASPQGQAPLDALELMAPLRRLTHLCVGRPFRRTTFDFSLMPALRWLSIRCYKAPQGHATLTTGCPGLEELELISSAWKLLRAAPPASLHRLTLHHAPGGELQCGEALGALTQLRSLVLRGQHSRELLRAARLETLRALFVEGNDTTLADAALAGATQLRLLHLAGTACEALVSDPGWPSETTPLPHLLELGAGTNSTKKRKKKAGNAVTGGGPAASQAPQQALACLEAKLRVALPAARAVAAKFERWVHMSHHLGM